MKTREKYLIAKPVYSRWEDSHSNLVTWKVVRVSKTERDYLLATTNARTPTLAEREAFERASK